MRREKGKPRQYMFVGDVYVVREPLGASVCINCGITVTRATKSANIAADAEGTLYTLC